MRNVGAGQCPLAAEALRTRRRLGPVDLHALGRMPAETLGGTYGRFMLERRLSPSSLPSLPGESDIEYVLAHIYETHDLWHVVTGFDTNTVGERALQAFYLAHERSYLPFFSLTAVLLNTAFFACDQQHVLWRPSFGRPLMDVRRELRLLPDNASRARVRAS